MRGWCQTDGCGWRGSYRQTHHGLDEYGYPRGLTFWLCIGHYQRLPEDEKERWTYLPPPGDEVRMLNRYQSAAHRDPPLPFPDGRASAEHTE